MEPDREKILGTLERIALSNPSDAISLALNWENTDLSRLDLWGVSEFKRGSGSCVEIKFTDRVKAISLLLEAMGGGEDGMKDLIEALEDSCG